MGATLELAGGEVRAPLGNVLSGKEFGDRLGGNRYDTACGVGDAPYPGTFDCHVGNAFDGFRGRSDSDDAMVAQQD